jgi:flagellar protein FlgJ
MTAAIPSLTGRPPAADALPSGATPELRRAAEEFEAVFLSQILRGLTEGLTGSGPLSGGGDDPYAAMLQDEHARLISRSGGIGIADAVLREMLKAQEVA